MKSIRKWLPIITIVIVVGMISIIYSLFTENTDFAILITVVIACVSIILQLIRSHQMEEARRDYLKPIVDVYDNFLYSGGSCSICLINDGEGLAKNVRAKLDGVDKSYESSQMDCYRYLDKNKRISEYTATFPLPDTVKCKEIRNPKFTLTWCDTSERSYKRIYPVIQEEWESDESDDPSKKNRVKVKLDKDNCELIEG